MCLVATRVLTGKDTLLSGCVVEIIGAAEGLSAGERGAVQRLAGTRGKDRSERPTSGGTAQQARLIFVPRCLIDEERVEDELLVELLDAIALAQIEGIVRRVFAGRLCFRAGAQSLAVGEVLL